MISSIKIFTEGIDKRRLRIRNISRLVRRVVEAESGVVGFINVIFCDDLYLLDINKEFLKHNTLTDVITFDYCVDLGNISGDIFISYDRVYENAIKFKVKIHHEVFRVVIHGVLHLLGYEDGSKAKAKVMRQKEDYYLGLFCSHVE